MTATDGAFVFVRVCTMFSVDLGSRDEDKHTPKKRAINYMLPRGQDDDTHPRSLRVQSNRAATVRTTTAPAFHTLTFVTVTVLWCSSICVYGVNQEIHATIVTFPRTIFNIQTHVVEPHPVTQQHTGAVLGIKQDA